MYVCLSADFCRCKAPDAWCSVWHPGCGCTSQHIVQVSLTCVPHYNLTPAVKIYHCHRLMRSCSTNQKDCRLVYKNYCSPVIALCALRARLLFTADKAVQCSSARDVEGCHSWHAQQVGCAQVERWSRHQHGLQRTQVNYLCPQRAHVSGPDRSADRGNLTKHWL